MLEVPGLPYDAPAACCMLCSTGWNFSLLFLYWSLPPYFLGLAAHIYIGWVLIYANNCHHIYIYRCSLGI